MSDYVNRGGSSDFFFPELSISPPYWAKVMHIQNHAKHRNQTLNSMHIVYVLSSHNSFLFCFLNFEIFSLMLKKKSQFCTCLISLGLNKLTLNMQEFLLFILYCVPKLVTYILWKLEQRPFSCFPFESFTRAVGEHARQTASPFSWWLSWDWQMAQTGRGLEVNSRQQRGHKAYYFWDGTCNGPMGMTVMIKAQPHLSITIHNQHHTHDHSHLKWMSRQRTNHEKVLSARHRQDDELYPACSAV